MTAAPTTKPKVEPKPKYPKFKQMWDAVEDKPKPKRTTFKKMWDQAGQMAKPETTFQRMWRGKAPTPTAKPGPQPEGDWTPTAPSAEGARQWTNREGIVRTEAPAAVEKEPPAVQQTYVQGREPASLELQAASFDPRTQDVEIGFKPPPTPRKPWGRVIRDSLARGALNTLAALDRTVARLHPAKIETVHPTADWAEKLLAEHPEWQPAQADTAMELVMSPKAMLGRITEMTPYVASTALATILGGPKGGLAVAGAIAFAVEGDAAYKDALANGASHREASREADVVGFANALIELAQVNEVVSFARGGRQALARTAGRNALKASKRGVGKQALRMAAREGLEEALQGTVQEGAAYFMGGRAPTGGIGAFIDRRLQEALPAALGFGLMGTAGRVAAAKIAPKAEPPAPSAKPSPKPTPQPAPVAKPAPKPAPAAPAPPAAPAEVKSAAQQARDALAAGDVPRVAPAPGWVAPATRSPVNGAIFDDVRLRKVRDLTDRKMPFIHEAVLSYGSRTMSTWRFPDRAEGVETVAAHRALLKAARVAPAEGAATSAAEMASRVQGRARKQGETYASPQFRVFDNKGREHLVNSGTYLRKMGLEPVPRKANYWRLAPAEKPAVAEKPPAKKGARDFLADEEGALNLQPIIEAGKQIEKTGQKVGAVFTRFTGLETNIKKSLLAHEENRVQTPKRAGEHSVELFKGFNKLQRRKMHLWAEFPTKSELPENQKAVVRRIKAEQQKLYDQLKDRGLVGEKGWPEGQIDALKDELAKTETLQPSEEAQKFPGLAAAHAAKKAAKIVQIQASLAKLEALKAGGVDYIHRLTKKPKAAQQLARWWRRTRRISKRPTGILGRKFGTIAEATAAGYEVADFAQSHAHYLNTALQSINNDKLIQAINSNPELAAMDKAAPEEWVPLDDRMYPSGKGRRYAPAIASALKELTGTSDKHVLVRIYDSLNSGMKLIGFYNPLIMTKNDLYQGWRASGLKFFYKIPKAVKVYQEKGKLYNDLRKTGLFSGVMNYTPAAEVIVEDMLAKIEQSKGARVARQLKKLIDPRKVVTNVQRYNQATTWQIDEVLRIATHLALSEGYRTGKAGGLVKKGWTFDQLAELSNDFMANYGKVPRATRRVLNRGVFTPTYRISMARMLARMWKQPQHLWPSLMRHYGYKLFVKYVLPGLLGLWIAGRWGAGRTEKGYRVVVKSKSGKEIAFVLSDPLLEEAKYTQRPILQSIKLNLAAVPHMLHGLLTGPRFKEDRKTLGHVFKFGAPLWRDIQRMADEDKTRAQKILTALAIAYVYKRKPRKEQKGHVATELLKAMSLWTDWKEQKEDIQKALGMKAKKPTGRRAGRAGRGR